MSLTRSNLSPFAHELDRYGSKCAHECPACHWVRERVALEVVASYDLKPAYQECELFQIGLEELGLA